MKIFSPGNKMTGQSVKKFAKKHLSSRNLLRTSLLIVFTGIFLFSLFKIATKLYAYQKEAKAYEDIRASIKHPDGIPAFAEPTREPADAMGEPEASQAHDAAKGIPSPPPLPYAVLRGDPGELGPGGIFKAYSSLKAQNADLVGWISMPGFSKVIDYPVMQNRDNDYYLTHDFYKNKSYSGSIFMDAVNISTEPDRNIIIYGHAMNDLSMFGNLVHYPDDETIYGKNTAIYMDLLDTRLEYQVFSAYSTVSSFDYRRTTFADDADFLSFLETIRGKSGHDFGVSLSPQDKIITLSTCDKNYGKDGRTVIHAKLTRQIIYDGSGSKSEYVKPDAESDKKIISSNVYIDELLLQYQVKNADDSPPAPDATEIPDISTVPDATQIPGTSIASDTGKAAMSTAAQWKDAVLDPPFTTKKNDFSTKVPAAADIAKLTVKADDPKAGLSYTLNGKAADPGRLALIEGDNVIALRVVSVDGLYARTYTIHVLKEPSPAESQPAQTTPTATETAASAPAASVAAAENQP